MQDVEVKGKKAVHGRPVGKFGACSHARRVCKLRLLLRLKTSLGRSSYPLMYHTQRITVMCTLFLRQAASRLGSYIWYASARPSKFFPSMGLGSKSRCKDELTFG